MGYLKSIRKKIKSGQIKMMTILSQSNPKCRMTNDKREPKDGKRPEPRKVEGKEGQSTRYDQPSSSLLHSLFLFPFHPDPGLPMPSPFCASCCCCFCEAIVCISKYSADVDTLFPNNAADFPFFILLPTILIPLFPAPPIARISITSITST